MGKNRFFFKKLAVCQSPLPPKTLVFIGFIYKAYGVTTLLIQTTHVLNTTAQTPEKKDLLTYMVLSVIYVIKYHISSKF